jgi:hypothetical protein
MRKIGILYFDNNQLIFSPRIMKRGLERISRLHDERGAIAIIVALLMSVFIGFTAYSVDIGHLLVVHNELQNASDAGALAGARFLYNADGTAVNSGANTIAYNSAVDNMSEGLAVEVDLSAGDVQRGHWSFATRTFTANTSLAPVDLFNKTFQELDLDLNFINAIKVNARRETSPAASYFARIFGKTGFNMQAEAIAYIGFAGTLDVGEADQPIVICEESLLLNGAYQCNIGRMINSGQNVASSETGGWSDFNQDSPCQGGTNANAVKGLVCGSGNPEVLRYGEDMATNGGQIQSAFNSLRTCWENTTNQNQLWNLTLPVVTCPGNNVGTCQEFVGAVNVNVVWITGAGEDPSYLDAPRAMESWSSADPDGQARWNDFVTYFNLQNVDGSPAPYVKKSIYFLPDCTPHVPSGGNGGANFGVLAKVPVLVN